jgi:hypothetical protein
LQNSLANEKAVVVDILSLLVEKTIWKHWLYLPVLLKYITSL